MRTVAAPRFARVLQVGVGLGASLLLAAAGANSLVAPLSRAAVTALLGATAPLAALVAPPEPTLEVSENAPAAPLELAFEAATQSPARRSVKLRQIAKPPALFVSQATVLKLAGSAARPRGFFVPSTAAHPAGLRLSGVAPLGIGLRDGDILIEALGLAPRGPGEIIGAIIEARAKQARFLSGTLWRQGQTFAITVEQPYPPARSPS
jgi:hypothetical protein